MSLASRYYDYYDYYNVSPWDREEQLDYHIFGNSKMFFAQFAFECLILLALISFSVWCCTLRNAISPLRVAIAALTIWMSAQIITVIIHILFIALAVVKEYAVISFILQYIFQLIAYCLVFATFYAIIQKLLNRLTDSGRPYKALNAFHWALVALIVILAIADFGFYTAVEVKSVTGDLTYKMLGHQYKLMSARAIVFFLVSVETLACTIFIAVKSTHRFDSKMPINSLLVGAVSWFGYHLMYTIVDIRYFLNYSYFGPYAPAYLDILTTVFQFVFVVGLFTGILLCVMYWHKVDQVKNMEMPVTSMQQPYGGGPVYYPPPPVEQHYHA